MNKSQPSSSPSSERFVAQQAFFESLDKLDRLVDKSNLKNSCEHTGENTDFSPWDEVAEDIEHALQELIEEE